MKFVLLFVATAAAYQNVMLINLDSTAQVETTVKTDADKAGAAISSTATSVSNTASADYKKDAPVVKADLKKAGKEAESGLKTAAKSVKGFLKNIDSGAS